MAFVAPEKKLFLAMAGNIGSGKTTAAKLISRIFDFELFEEPVVDNRFLADYYQNMKRWSFTLNLEFLIKRVQHHDLISRVEKSCIQDRTLYEDPEIFAKYLHGLGHMDDRELELYFEYFDKLNRSLHRPQKVILLYVSDVSALQSRIQKRGRAEEAGISREFLEGLNGYYSVLPQILEKKYEVEVLKMDVSHLDIRSGEGQDLFLDKVQNFLHR